MTTGSKRRSERNGASRAEANVVRMPSTGAAAPWARDHSRAESVPAATELLREDAMPSDVFWIEDGIVQLTRRGRAEAPTLVGLRFPGWIVGAESAIVGARAPISAWTLTRCTLHRLARQKFLRLLRTDAKLSWRMNQMHGREAFDQMVRANDSSLPPAQRLRVLLAQLIEANEATALAKTIQLRLPLNTVQIAQLLSAPVESIPQLFAQLEDEKYLRVNGERLIITSPRRLHQAPLADVGWPINASRRNQQATGDRQARARKHARRSNSSRNYHERG
jgi:CRP-like cAMP-binding protein